MHVLMLRGLSTELSHSASAARCDRDAHENVAHVARVCRPRMSILDRPCLAARRDAPHATAGLCTLVGNDRSVLRSQRRSVRRHVVRGHRLAVDLRWTPVRSGRLLLSSDQSDRARRHSRSRWIGYPARDAPRAFQIGRTGDVSRALPAGAYAFRGYYNGRFSGPVSPADTVILGP